MLTFFRKQPLQIRLSLRARGEAPRPRVSTATCGVYRVCVARRRVRGCETGAPVGGAGGRAACGCSPGNCRGRGRPMLWRHIRVVRPRRAISSDGSRRVRVGRVGPGCLCVCCWGVSVRICARLARVVIRHDTQVATQVDARRRSILPPYPWVAPPTVLFQCSPRNIRVNLLRERETAPKFVR